MAKKILPVAVAAFALAMPMVASAKMLGDGGMFAWSDLALFALGIGGLLIGRQASRT